MELDSTGRGGGVMGLGLCNLHREVLLAGETPPAGEGELRPMSSVLGQGDRKCSGDKGGLWPIRCPATWPQPEGSLENRASLFQFKATGQETKKEQIKQ